MMSSLLVQVGSAVKDELAKLTDYAVGWHGLIAATTYLRLAPGANLLILDNCDTIGGVWSKEKIYPNLFAQVGHGLFEYSFYPMKKEGISADRYISGSTIHHYLTGFAKTYDLVRRTRLGTTVTTVKKLNQGGWQLAIAGSPPIRCDKLIYAAGATSIPVIPSWPTDNFQKPVVHSSQVGSSLKMLQGARRVQRSLALPNRRMIPFSCS